MRADRLLLALGLVAAIGCSRDAAPAASGPETPQAPVEARASVDRAVATTGDVLRYTLTVDHAADVAVDIPEVGSEIAGFRIVDLGRDQPVEKGNRIVETRWYELRADLVGSYVLPPVEIPWRPVDQPDAAPESVVTSELFVEVASVLPDGEEATDLRGLKPLRPRPESPLLPWLGGGLAVLLGALALWLFVRRRRRRKAEPPRPAHEIAFEALDRLRATDFDDPEAVRRYFFALSEVVRGYVEGRWGLNATDLTTEEIVATLAAGHPMPPQAEELLRRFLLATDRVKFAAHRPSPEEIQGAYENALSFVESTRPTEEELAAEEPEEVAA